MAYLKGQKLDCWDLTRSQRSLLLTQNLAIVKSGEDGREIIKREEPALTLPLFIVQEGGTEPERTLAALQFVLPWPLRCHDRYNAHNNSHLL